MSDFLNRVSEIDGGNLENRMARVTCHVVRVWECDLLVKPVNRALIGLI